MSQPTPNGPDGRDPATGRFLPGWKGGPGNPHAARVGKLRQALLDAVTPEDIGKVVAALVREAQAGNIPAIKELLDRTLGKPTELDLIDRLEQLEAALAASAN